MQKNIKLNLVCIHFINKHTLKPAFLFFFFFLNVVTNMQNADKIKTGTKEEKDEAKRDRAQSHTHWYFASDSQ